MAQQKIRAKSVGRSKIDAFLNTRSLRKKGEEHVGEYPQ